MATETKACPSCGADVPVAATRCKHCFYDFAAEGAEAKKSNAMVGLLGFILVLALGLIGTAYYLYTAQSAEKVIVDQETKSIVFTETSAAGTSTDRVPFDRITKIEHVIGGGGPLYKVVAIGNDGKSYIIQQSQDVSLNNDATHIAGIMGKPFEEINNVPGFDEPTDQPK